LGLPLFAAAAEQCEGNLTIESEEGKGTTVTATFRHGHIDRAPLGDIESALLSIILAERECDVYYVHQVNGRKFEFDTAEIKRELSGVPISHPQAREWLNGFISEGEQSLESKKNHPRILANLHESKK
jgi:hypothetical protein